MAVQAAVVPVVQANKVQVQLFQVFQMVNQVIQDHGVAVELVEHTLLQTVQLQFIMLAVAVVAFKDDHTIRM